MFKIINRKEELPLNVQIQLLEHHVQCLDQQCKNVLNHYALAVKELEDLYELEEKQDELINQTKYDFSDEYDEPKVNLFDIVKGWFRNDN